MVPICTERWCTEANEATQTHCYHPSRRLTLFEHIMRMDDNADAKRILLASPPADWRRQPGRPRITWLSTVQQDLKQHHLTLPEEACRFGSEPPSAEDDVDVWRYAILELHARNDDDDEMTLSDVWRSFQVLSTVSLPVSNKNLDIANRSCAICTHSTSRASRLWWPRDLEI